MSKNRCENMTKKTNWILFCFFLVIFTKIECEAIMAAPIEAATSKRQPTERNCIDTSDLEEKIARISIDGDAVAAVVAEDDVIGTVSSEQRTENCSSRSIKSDCDEIDSNIPPGFNDIDHIFHIDFMRSMESLMSQQEKRYIVCNPMSSTVN